jgi:hypothetical protein
MQESADLLESIHTEHLLKEVNHYILGDAGEIMHSPGKVTLVWTDPLWEIKRYLAVKVSGADAVLINGRRYPATIEGLQQGLVACLKDIR